EAILDGGISAYIDLPVRTRHVDAAMVIPGPRPSHEHETYAAVAELMLQQGAGVGGDQVGGGGGIAVMNDMDALPFEERFVKMIQHMRRVGKIPGRLGYQAFIQRRVQACGRGERIDQRFGGSRLERKGQHGDGARQLDRHVIFERRKGLRDQQQRREGEHGERRLNWDDGSHQNLVYINGAAPLWTTFCSPSASSARTAA